MPMKLIESSCLDVLLTEPIFNSCACCKPGRQILIKAKTNKVDSSSNLSECDGAALMNVADALDALPVFAWDSKQLAKQDVAFRNLQKFVRIFWLSSHSDFETTPFDLLCSDLCTVRYVETGMDGLQSDPEVYSEES